MFHWQPISVHKLILYAHPCMINTMFLVLWVIFVDFASFNHLTLGWFSKYCSIKNNAEIIKSQMSCLHLLFLDRVRYAKILGV